MALQIGDQAPNFTANTTEGEIDFHNWLGDSWGVFMSHPADFTPVCTTEIGRVANLKGEFDKRNAKTLVVSVGTKPDLTPIESHREWIKDVNETQKANVEFPLVEDPDRYIANAYGMIHPNANDTLTVRSVFIIGPDKAVKLIISCCSSASRMASKWAAWAWNGAGMLMGKTVPPMTSSSGRDGPHTQNKSRDRFGESTQA